MTIQNSEFSFRGAAGIHYPQNRMVQPDIHAYTKPKKERKKGEQKKEKDNVIVSRNVDAIFL